jgi:hypothetical protein
MAAQGHVQVISEPKPRILRVFISYAREDEKIAVAAFEAIRTALGTFADVFIDNALQFGVSFQDEIRKRLDETDLLVVIYSATLKPSHSFIGMELGFFLGTVDPHSLLAERIESLVSQEHAKWASVQQQDPKSKTT